MKNRLTSLHALWIFAVMALSITLNAAPLQVDLQSNGRNTADAPTPAGWEAWELGESFDSGTRSTTFDYPLTTDGSLDVSIQTTTAAGARNYGLDAITDPGRLSFSEVFFDLFFFNNDTSGSLTLSLEDLKAGAYELTTYHYADNLSAKGSSDDSGIANISVNGVDTGLDASLVMGANRGEPKTAAEVAASARTIRFIVARDGDPVSILYDGLAANGGGDSFGLNGFQLVEAGSGTAEAAISEIAVPSVPVAPLSFPANDLPSSIERARASAPIAGYSLGKVKRWLHEVALPKINENGLYVSYTKKGSARYRSLWNYDDAAADTYPFLFWAAWYTDMDQVNGPIHDVLVAEQKHCNLNDHPKQPYGRVPTAVNPDTLEKEIRSSGDTMFAASEYVKDGLIAIVEVAGKDNPWFDRMQGIIDDMWAHASVSTPYGLVPTVGTEADGEQLQALARLFTMTDDPKYLDWAERIADKYMLPGGFVPTKLRDHGSEIVGGLGLLYGVLSVHRPEKAEVYRPHIRFMLDGILERGTNEDGLMYNKLGQPKSGLSDSWGYNYVGHLCYDWVVGEARYTPGLQQTLRNLSKPLYDDYRWEGTSIDGYADSIEGSFYLLNRFPVPEGIAWANEEMADHVTRTQDPNVRTTSLWGTYKLESNGVRTVLQHAMMHTRGLIARPWELDLELGAAQTADGVVISMTSESPYSGTLEVDKPRHRLDMGFTRDWPRMNTMPEWFVAEPDADYLVKDLKTGTTSTHSGAQLHAGLPVTLEAGVEKLLHIRKM